MCYKYTKNFCLKIITENEWTTVNRPLETLNFRTDFLDCGIMGYTSNGTYTDIRYNDSLNRPIVYYVAENAEHIHLYYKGIRDAEWRKYKVTEIGSPTDEDWKEIKFKTDLNPNKFTIKMTCEVTNLNGEKFKIPFLGSRKC